MPIVLIFNERQFRIFSVSIYGRECGGTDPSDPPGSGESREVISGHKCQGIFFFLFLKIVPLQFLGNPVK
jgi:hypothetical protein